MNPLRIHWNDELYNGSIVTLGIDRFDCGTKAITGVIARLCAQGPCLDHRCFFIRGRAERKN